ncbi:prepilin peptidase [Methylomarinum vadi]|uniref:prepilin peptidase n=1 Tax=Methylomarinum vadi TaxID=438855 RepID=UPI0004DFB1F3|nr:A24 family peptidase [Methylomarinum vadi]
MQLLLDALQQSPTLLISCVFILGLMVGSFLNVVIFRLPVMMNRDWRKECREYLELETEAGESEPFNLMVPASHCPHCQTEIKPYQNIPVLSYLFLGGKCAQCGYPISIRYPLIEAFTGFCSALVAWHFGFSVAMLFGLLLTWSLIAASFIDIDQQLLPDSIILPMLWLGLFLSLFSVYTDSASSIIGAIAGYLSLWTVYQLFKLVTGKEGMGFGDFKLLALFGAWLGWQYLPLIILLSSLVGAVIGIAMVILVKHDRNTPIPFGPYLAAAGWLAMLWGEDINRLYLHTVGL